MELGHWGGLDQQHRVVSKPIIAVVFYSTYGHVAQLAEKVIEGVKATGAEARPYVFQETLSEDVLTKMHAGASLKPKYPIITPDGFAACDGVIIGTPTRYGRVPAQVSTFFDRCGGLWAKGAMVGKFVSMFTSTAGQHGGQETTALTSMPFFIHMGMVYVPIAYTHPFVNETAEGVLHGAVPWGASTVASGDGSRQPTEGELDVAVHQGKMFSSFVATYVKGKQA